MNNLLAFFLFQPEVDVVKEDVEKVSEGFKSSWDTMWERIGGWKEKLIENLPEIFLAIFVFTVCYFISVYVKKWLQKPLAKVIKRTSVRSLITNVISIFIVLIGLIIAISVLNLSNLLTGVLAAGGIAGIAVALAFQGVLANTFSGIFISITDILNVGDFIQTNGYSGNVEEITLRNTRIREVDNNIVIIPNKNIIENPFKNFSLTPRIRSTILCSVDYNADMRFVKKISTEAINKRFPQLEYEHVEFHWTEFADSSINFQIRFWIEARANLTLLEAKSEAMMILKETFDAHGIQIPFPVTTLEWPKDAGDSFDFPPKVKN
ncbi:MAG: mechanosensitive ion channel family protein [Flavobacteriaceae bacterium]|nr:mechanosensitive ion channel family protein [Flavobacteriaceae bacterium]